MKHWVNSPSFISLGVLALSLSGCLKAGDLKWSGAGVAALVQIQGTTQITAGTCTAFNVVALDSGSANTTFSSSKTFNLSGAGSGVFYSDSGCTIPITSLSVIQGSSNTAFYYRNTSVGSLTFSTQDSSGEMSNASQSVSVVPGAVQSIAFTTSPPATASACTNFSAAPSVVLRDAYSNTATNATGTVTLEAFTDISCTVPATGTLTMTPQFPSSGTATFSTVQHSLIENIYIRARSGLVTSPCSALVFVSAGGASQIVFNTQPSSNGFASFNLAQQPSVQIKDACNNLVTAGSYPVTLAGYSDSGCTTAGGGTLGAVTNPLSSASGIANFSGVNYSSSGVFYFKASSAGLSSACSSSVSLNTVAGLSVSDGPTYDYGTQAAGSSTDKTFTVTYSGGVAATGVTPSGLAAPFSFKGGSYPGTGGTCGASISANCTVVLTYNPTVTGSSSNTLTLTFNNGAVGGQISTRAIQGNAINPATLSISDGPTYDYGTQAVSSSIDKTFTVSYAGSVAATGLAGSGLAAPFSFKGGSYPGTGGTCGASISASCTLVVTYNPTIAGSSSNTLTLTYSNGLVGGQTATRAIQGNAINPATLSISDGPMYDYGTLATGTSTDKTFTVTYSGGVAATGLAGSGLAAPFSFKGGSYPGTGGTCGASISANCTVVINYAPSVTGLSSNTLTLTYNNGLIGGQTATRSIQGTGANPAVLTISDASVYIYGNVGVGASADHTFTIAYSGGVPATGVAPVALSAPFSFKGGTYPGVGGDCGSTVSANCSVVVTYTPTTNVTSNSSLDLNYNNGASGQISTRQISGTGIFTRAVLSFNEGTTFDYGSRGSIVDHTFTLKNIGVATATVVSNLTFPSGDFTYKGGSFPGVGGDCGLGPVPVGAACVVVVTFNPSGAGLKSSSFSVNYDDGLGVTQNTVIAIQGTATTNAVLSIADWPAYAYTAYGFPADPATYDFGTAGVSALEHTFYITNTGAMNATALTGVGLLAPYSFKGGSYPGVGGSCAGNLNIGESCSVVVQFAPFVTGPFPGSLGISYNDGSGAQTVSRNITGNYTANAFLIVQDYEEFSNLTSSYDYGVIGTSNTVNHTFVIKNTGPASASTLVTGPGMTGTFTYVGGVFPGTGGNCGTVLNSGKSCKIVVSYNSPGAPGTSSGIVAVQYFNGVSTQTATRNLNGSATSNAVVSINDSNNFSGFSSAPFDYGTSGITLDHTFYVKNSGAVSAPLADTSNLGAFFQFKGGTYPGNGGTCVGSLPSGASCTLVVSFVPGGSSGAKSGQISLNYSGQIATRSLIATATIQANLVISNYVSGGGGDAFRDFDYGSLGIGSLFGNTFVVMNTGAAAAIVNAVSSVIQGNNPSQFRFSGGGAFPGNGGTCGGILNSGSSCTVSVEFSPTVGPNALNAQLRVVYSGGSLPDVIRNIQGQSTNRALFQIIDCTNGYCGGGRDPYEYGVVAAGFAKSNMFLLKNIGAASATFGAGTVQFTGIDSSFYRFGGGTAFPGTGGTCGTSLAVNATCTIALEFFSSSVNTIRSSVFEMTYNDGSNQSVSRELTATVTNDAYLTIQDCVGCGGGGKNPLPYNYGTLGNSYVSSNTFNIKNDGAFSATFDPSSITGFDASQFRFAGGGAFPGTGGTCGGTLSPGSSCTVVVEFAPTVGSNQKNATLNIAYRNLAGPIQPTVTRALQGTSTSNGFLTVTDCSGCGGNSPHDFGKVGYSTGFGRGFSFTVKNVGAAFASSISGSVLPSGDYQFTGGSYPGIAGTCGASLSAQTLCTVEVEFRPSSGPGTRSAQIDLSYNGGAGIVHALKDVTGYSTDQSSIVILDSLVAGDNPNPVNFSSTLVGNTYSQSVTLVNYGKLSATLSNQIVLGADFGFYLGGYPGSGGTCGGSLTPGSNCTVVLKFQPFSIGQKTGTFQLDYTDAFSTKNVSRGLAGTGL